MSHDAHHHAPDREWMGLGLMAIVMVTFASILGVLATQTAPAGPGPAAEKPAIEASTGLSQGTHQAPPVDPAK